jgi:GT2 family glycosyltransferase
VISVIVSNFNGLRWLPRLLGTLRAQRGVETEILVVDRESTDGSGPYLAAQPDVRVISEPPQTGLVAGYQRGVPFARGELLFFCNEDMWFEPDCLARLAAAIDLPARIGAADPWQWTYDGTEWVHGVTRFVPARWSRTCPYPRRAADFTVDLPVGTETPFACAGALLIHRDVHAELGGWDPSFFLDHEDIDLFLRAWQRGWRCVAVADARVYHAISAANAHVLASTGQSVMRRRYVGQRANIPIIAIKYFRWTGVLLALAQWPAAILANLVSGKFRRVWDDLAVPGDLLRRAPSALAFRQANAPFNVRSPGERFFTEPRFARDDGAGTPQASP